MIIFVHFPKAGGSSVRSALKTAYGKRLFLDNDFFRVAPERTGPEAEQLRRRIHVEIEERQVELVEDYDIVFGHFRADKYNFFGDSAQRCIILREPISRLCSEYFFHVREGNFKKRGQEGISLLEFAELSDQIEFYRSYLGDLSLSRFDVIGLVELLPMSLELYRRKFGVTLEVSVENKGDVADYFSYLRDLHVLEEVAQLQAENLEIYREGMGRFFDLWKSTVSAERAA